MSNAFMGEAYKGDGSKASARNILNKRGMGKGMVHQKTDGHCNFNGRPRV
jgi:hypothetical protein